MIPRPARDNCPSPCYNYAKVGAQTPTLGATPGIVSGGRSSVYTRRAGWRKGPEGAL